VDFYIGLNAKLVKRILDTEKIELLLASGFNLKTY
jgi:hypothetical protein